MNEIKIWLESEEKNFDQGYQLLAKVFKNQSILHYLQRKRDQAKLEYELSKLVPSASTASRSADEASINAPVPELVEGQTIIEKHDTKLKIVQSGQINYDQLPEALKPIYDNTISKYKEMRSVHEKMKLATSDEQRAELRKTLDELDTEIESGWVVINTWTKTGKLPASTDSAAGALNIDYKSVNAARTYVSRAIKTAETATGKKLEKLIPELQIKVDILVAAAAEIKPETWEKLLTLGIKAPVAPAANTEEVEAPEIPATDPEDVKKPEAPVAE